MPLFLFINAQSMKCKCVEISNEKKTGALNVLHHGSTHFCSNSNLVHCKVNFVKKNVNAAQVSSLYLETFPYKVQIHKKLPQK